MRLRFLHALVVLLALIPMRSPANELVERYKATYASIQYDIPTLDGTAIIGNGGGYLLNRERGLWVTAAHVIPEQHPGLKPGYLKIDGVEAELVCFDPIADQAILQTAAVPEDKIEATLGIPVEGMEVLAVMGRGLSQFANKHHAKDAFTALVTTANQTFQAQVVSVFEALEYDGDLDPNPTDVFFFSLDKAVRTGFSGGPMMSLDGTVVGIAATINGGISYISASINTERLLGSERCQSALHK